MVSAASAGILAAGSLGAGVLSGIAANAASYKQYKYQSQLQREQAKLNYSYGKKTELNKYGWTRQGLESAGYNPMLAIQNASSNINSSWTSGGSVNAPDYGSAVSNAIDVARLRNETETANSQKELNNANASLSNAQTVAQLLENDYIPEKNKATIANLWSQKELNQATIENFDKRLELDSYLGNLNNAVSVANNKRTVSAMRYSADTYSNVIKATSPSGRSQSFRNYVGGIADLIHGASSGYDTYDKYDFNRRNNNKGKFGFK